MRNTTIISILTLSFSLIGCDSNSSEPSPTPEVKPPAPAVTNTDDTINNGISQSTNTLTIGNITLQVTVKGSITPNGSLDVSLIQTSGPPAAAIRVWVGDASGVGSMKTRTHSHGSSSHAHAKAPATLPADSALWIEVQNADGTSGSGSLSLK